MNSKASPPTPNPGTSLSLRPHQRRAAEQFVRQCYCSGILLYHRMGTGKTATVLATLMNYPHKRVLLLHPVGLDSQWVSEVAKYFNPMAASTQDAMAHLPFQIDFMSYTDFFETLPLGEVQARVDRCSIIVADEAQKISMQKIAPTMPLDQKQRIDAARGLLMTRRCILVTGTPIDDNIANLALLVNIAAQRQVLPYNDVMFMRQFGSTRVPHAVLSYVAPAMFSVALMVVLSSVLGLPSFLQSFQPVFTENAFMEQLPANLWGANLSWEWDGEASALQPSMVSDLVEQNEEEIVGIAMLSQTGRKKVLQATKAINTMISSNALSNLAGSVMDMAQTYVSQPISAWLQTYYAEGAKRLGMKPVQIKLSPTAAISSTVTVFDLLYFPILYLTLAGLVYKLYTNVTKGKERYVDAAKLYLVVRDYMTFFDYNYDPTGIAQLHFPKLNLVKKPFHYDKLQTLLFVRFITGRVSRGDLFALEMVSDSPTDWEGLTNKPSMAKYLDKGRLIANASADDLTYFEWASRVTITADATTRALTAMLSDVGSNEVGSEFHHFTCLKFSVLEGAVKKDVRAGKRVVIYSCFRKTFDNLSVFFSNRGIQHLKLNAADSLDTRVNIQNMFANRALPYNVLLLDPLLTEGINLGVAQTLHVLEPISNWGQQEQVYARVLRQLPAPAASDDQRPVSTVVQWVDALPGVASMVQRTIDLAYGGALQQAGITPADVGAWAFGSRAAMFVQEDKSNFAALTNYEYPHTATPGELTLENLKDIELVMNKLQRQLAATTTGAAPPCGSLTERECSIWENFALPGTCQTAPELTCPGGINQMKGGAKDVVRDSLSGGYVNTMIRDAFVGMVRI